MIIHLAYYDLILFNLTYDVRTVPDPEQLHLLVTSACRCMRNAILKEESHDPESYFSITLFSDCLRQAINSSLLGVSISTPSSFERVTDSDTVIDLAEVLDTVWTDL